MPKFSVIIPVYNRAHCIVRALESVRAQGLGEWELVIGDDASTDGTVEVARGEFAFWDSDAELLPALHQMKSRILK